MTLTSLKMMSYSSMLFVVFSLLVTKSNALKTGEIARESQNQYHIVEISSLLPASDCSPSTTSTKGSNKWQSTLEVYHKHGPCSRDKSTTTPSLSELLSHDQSRVESIQTRLTPKSKANKINIKKVNVPAHSGRSFGSENYVVRVGFGTPTELFTLIFDTGSDLAWMQCQPCIITCYEQQDPIFNPYFSTSYSNISCTSSTCVRLNSSEPRCSASTCIYRDGFDQSFSIGYLSKDKLTISPTDVFPNFIFGCGQNNVGMFGTTAGVLGLSKHAFSIVSQTSNRYRRYFSYCLPSISSTTGYLALGKSPNSSNAKFTPMANSDGTSFYFIDILTVSIGGRQLLINQTVFSNARTIIDSRTVISRLPPAAYRAMSSAFKEAMSHYPRASAISILDTCYDLSNYTTVSVPTISFTLSGNVTVDLHPSGILVLVDSSHGCLAFAANYNDNQVGIFGNTQQKTFQVVYDVAGGMIGFGARGCI